MFLVAQELPYPSGAPQIIPCICGNIIAPSLVFGAMFCISLFVLLSFFNWSLYFVVIWFTALITPLVYSYFSSYSSDYLSGIFILFVIQLWLPLWYIHTFRLTALITPLVFSYFSSYSSDYPSGIFILFVIQLWLPLWYLHTFRLTALITPLVSSYFSSLRNCVGLISLNTWYNKRG